MASVTPVAPDPCPALGINPVLQRPATCWWPATLRWAAARFRFSHEAVRIVDSILRCVRSPRMSCP
eukprot:169744-Pyramimonas_sp.AAC.1